MIYTKKIKHKYSKYEEKYQVETENFEESYTKMKSKSKKIPS